MARHATTSATFARRHRARCRVALDLTHLLLKRYVDRLALWPCCDNPSPQFCAASGVNARLADRSGDQSVSDRLFACQLPQPPRRFGFLSRSSDRWLLVEASPAHLSEQPLPLHLLLQYTKRQFHVVVSNEYLQARHSYPIIGEQNRAIPQAGAFKSEVRDSLENDPGNESRDSGRRCGAAAITYIGSGQPIRYRRFSRW